MKELIIDRSKWFRGQEPCESALLRRDGKMCCLGIYLQACGVSDERLLGRKYPSGVTVIPDEASWLVLGGKGFLYPENSEDAAQLAVKNDDPSLFDSERESFVAEKFAEHGIKVTFVDGPTPLAGNTKETA